MLYSTIEKLRLQFRFSEKKLLNNTMCEPIMRWKSIVFSNFRKDTTMKVSRMLSIILFLIFAPIIQVMGTNYAYTLMPGDEEYLPFADEMPAPVNGLEGIIKSVKYPELARKAGMEGKVYVMAFINERGGVDDVKVVKGIGAGCDEAAADAVRKAKFNPGKQGGKAVKCKMSLSIAFKLK